MSGAPAIVDPRAAWKAERRHMLTASDVAAVLGEDPRRSAFQVWADKVGDVETEETEAMARGRDFEEAIGRAYGRQTGRPVGSLNPYEIARHPDIPWLGATLDRTTLGTVRSPDPFGGVEIRAGQTIAAGTVASGRAPLQIKMALGSASEWKDEPPLGYVVQVNIEMACFRAQWGALCALVGPGPLKTIDLVRNDDFLRVALPKLEQFWRLVQRREPPPVDALPGTAEAIRKLWPGANGETVPLDEDAGRLMDHLEAARARIAAAEETERGLANQLRVRMGEASFGGPLQDGSFVERAVVTRKPYEVEGTTYTTLRRRRPRIRR